VDIPPKFLLTLNLVLCSALAWQSLQENRSIRDRFRLRYGLRALPLLGILVSGVTLASVQAWLPSPDRELDRCWYDFDTFSGRELPLAGCLGSEQISGNFSGVLLLTRRGCESCDPLHESGELPRLLDSLRDTDLESSETFVRLDADAIAACLLVETPAILQLRQGRLWRDFDADEIKNQIENHNTFRWKQ